MAAGLVVEHGTHFILLVVVAPYFAAVRTQFATPPAEV